MEDILSDTEKELDALLEKFSDNTADWPEENLEAFIKSKVVVVEEFFGLFEEPMLKKIKDAEYIIFKSYISEQNSNYMEMQEALDEEFGETHNGPFIVSRELLLISFRTYQQAIAFYINYDLDDDSIMEIKHLGYDHKALIESNKKYLQFFNDGTDDELRIMIDELKISTVDFTKVLKKFVDICGSAGARSFYFLRILGKYLDKNNISTKTLGSDLNKKYLIELTTNFFNGKGNLNRHANTSQIINGIDYYFSDIECASMLQNSPQLDVVSNEAHRYNYKYLKTWKDVNPDEFFISIVDKQSIRVRK